MSLERVRLVRLLLGAVLAAVVVGSSARARAERPREPAATAASEPWSHGHTEVARAIASGQPLVVRVVVALCDNALIDCGASWAGQPRRPETNIYWGAVFGARRFLERKGSAFVRLSLESPGEPILERAVYRRSYPGAPWGRDGEEIEQIVVLDAYDGRAIDQATAELYGAATAGSRVRVSQSGSPRELPVHVVGYVGHNCLMDGVSLPADPPPPAHAIPCFVLACASDPYFGARLRAAGSRPLVMTRTLMAPEGYVLAALLDALGRAATPGELRAAAVGAYARWQRISTRAAGHVFSSG